MKALINLLFTLLIAITTASAQQKTDSTKQQQADSTSQTQKGSPVAPFRDTLFYLNTRQGSFTARDRAATISARINKLSDDITFRADSLKLDSAEENIDVLFKDQMLISVSDRDALAHHTTKAKLAADIRNKIGAAIVTYQQQTRWQTLLRESLLALLVIVVVVLLIYGINRLVKLLLVKLQQYKETRIKSIRVNNYELLDTSTQVFVLKWLINLARWVIIVLIVYLALPILFDIFPVTRDLSNTLIGYVAGPLKKIGLAIWHYVPNLITIAVLVFIFYYILRLLKFIKTEIEKGSLTIGGFYADWANPTYQIVRVLTLAFMLIVIFPYLPGSQSPIFQGVSVFMGVLFTFGSAGALSNVVAGLVMTYMRSFKIGDRVKIGDATGDIIEKNLLVTRIRTIQNEVVSIPNSSVMSNQTINFSSEAQTKGLIVHTTVTIGYDAPWRQVHQLLIDAALNTPMIEHDPKPYVLQTSLDDYYVSYRINAHTKEANKQAVIYSALHANIQDEFNKGGVEIMSPHYKALRDGNATTIPPDYLPKDYIAPAFNTQPRKE